MAATINYKTFYAGDIGYAGQYNNAITSNAWSQHSTINFDSIGDTSSVAGKNNPAGAQGTAWLKTALTPDGGVPSDTIWSIEELNVSLSRRISANTGAPYYQRNCRINYGATSTNYDQFQIVLNKGGGATEIPLTPEIKIQSSSAFEDIYFRRRRSSYETVQGVV